MGYDPSSVPSNQTALGAVNFKGRVWVFYYESGGELYVLKSGSGKDYTHTKVLDENGKPIQYSDQTHPIAVTSNSRNLQLYYVEKTTNLWKELVIYDNGTYKNGGLSAFKFKAGLPATVSATTVNDDPKVYLTVQGTQPHFTIATYSGKGWTTENLETADKPSIS